MMALTHLAISTCTAAIILGSADGYVLGIAAIASQLPDIDTTRSFTGRALYPVAAWIETKYAHRSVTHSFAASGVLAIASIPLVIFSWQYWGALNIGFFMGWFADCFTKAGVAALYPSNKRLVIPGNPNNRMRSGGTGEYWLLATAIALLIISINLITNGGVVENFSRSMLKDPATASDMFRRYGSEKQVFVQVKGVHGVTNQSVDQEYKVIGSTGQTSVIAKDSKGILYQIGNDPASQIKPNSIDTRIGKDVSITSKEMILEDILAIDWLNGLPNNAYVTGSLIVDDLDQAKAPLVIDRFPTISIFAGQIQLSNASKQELITGLGDQYILQARLIIKVRSDE